MISIIYPLVPTAPDDDSTTPHPLLFHLLSLAWQGQRHRPQFCRSRWHCVSLCVLDVCCCYCEMLQWLLRDVAAVAADVADVVCCCYCEMLQWRPPQ